MEKARQTGVAVATVFNSCHFGAAGYYTHWAAQQGFLGWAVANDVPTVGMLGACGPLLGTNPFAFSAPAADGQPMVLEWDMTSAATSLGMGVILPDIKQPGWYVARLLHEAPLGLALLAASLVVTWLLLGRETDLFSLGILVVAYYLFYTLVAYLSDHLTSFTACFVLAALATLVLTAGYLWLGWGRRFASHQTLALVAAFTVYYPLAVVMDEYTGLMVQVLYWALAAYAAGLAVTRIWRARRAA